MAQKGIREFDAKKMRSEYTKKEYAWLLIENKENIAQIITDILPDHISRVVKPDQLFWKRSKHWLLGVNLTKTALQQWLHEHRWTQQTISGVSDQLDTFLIEPFIPHTQEQERYVSIRTERTDDIITFSKNWWVDIEEQRESTDELRISVVDELDKATIVQALWPLDEAVIVFLLDLIGFFRSYGMTYLEVNPFVVDEEGIVHCLDMVAKVDSCESHKQKHHRAPIKRVAPFGTSMHPLEETIKQLDNETGASLKFTTLNPQWSIGLILWWWWASVVTMDTLAAMGALDGVINYGELSGNPNYRHNKAYVQGLVALLCENKQPKKYLCLIGWIANFTDIAVLCQAFVDALTEEVDSLKSNNIHIVVRRWWVNDSEGLALVRTFCETHEIPYSLADWDVYLTEPIHTMQIT